MAVESEGLASGPEHLAGVGVEGTFSNEFVDFRATFKVRIYPIGSSGQNQLLEYRFSTCVRTSFAWICVKERANRS